MRERKKTRGMLLIEGNTVREMGSLGVENTGNAILILCRKGNHVKRGTDSAGTQSVNTFGSDKLQHDARADVSIV